MVLTKFQEKCDVEISKLASLCSVQIVSRELEGKDEIYIHIILNVNSIDIWVYGEECMFSGDKCEVHFEKTDYKNSDELLDDFINTLERYIKGDDVSNSGTGFIKLFDLKDI